MVLSAELEVISYGPLECCVYWRWGLERMTCPLFFFFNEEIQKFKNYRIGGCAYNRIGQLKEIAWQVQNTKFLA